jgi:pimeloyl-ACP methyl ester carboxylesterase
LRPQREDVRFDTGDGHCAAWLYRPDHAPQRAPVVVLGHGMGGVREMRLDAVCRRFRVAGYACLAFDYRHFGASDGDPRQLLDIDRQLTDWAAALRYVRHRNDLDPTRIVPVGRTVDHQPPARTPDRRHHCPVLFCVCETDSVAPARATLHHARRAPRAEIRSYPVGHFDIYRGRAFERIIHDQIAFLDRHVLSGEARSR